jgi:hypothetical protein
MSRQLVYTTTKSSIERHSIEFLKRSQEKINAGLAKIILGLNMKDPSSLQLAMILVIEGKYEQKRLSESLVVSRTSLNRWANGKNIPRSAAYRGYLLNKIADFVLNKSDRNNAAGNVVAMLKRSG